MPHNEQAKPVTVKYSLQATGSTVTSKEWPNQGPMLAVTFTNQLMHSIDKWLQSRKTHCTRK